MTQDACFHIYSQRARARGSKAHPTMRLVLMTSHKQTAKVYVAQREALGQYLVVFYRNPAKGIVKCVHTTT